jgi:hypothetical protein
MKKIGFIDYFLDEWHANNYPEWIKNESNGEMQVTYAYGLKDSDNGISNAAWCDKYDVTLLGSIEEVVQKSDYLVVLSPDYPEFHEELAQIPLASGKPTYIDKTFALDRLTAERLFARADEYGTPLYSSSALRFASEYMEAERSGIKTISSIGPGKLENYSIHQIEPIVSLMGCEATRVMYIGTPHSPALLIEFTDGRQATIHQFGGGAPFQMMVHYSSDDCKQIKVESDFFQLFTRSLVTFFETGNSIVSSAETIAVITIIEYGLLAVQTPYQWLNLPTKG